MRWVIVVLVGAASAGLMAVSVAMNFAFGSSFGRTGFESYAYGAAFGFADVLKVAAPIAMARSFANRNWGVALLGLLLWGSFTACSIVSAIGFASANRTFVVDSRTIQAALNQSRLDSLETDQTELRRLRNRLASPEVRRGERIQLAAAAEHLETAIGATRGKLEDAAPVVTMPNPQAHTLAQLTGTDIGKIEVGLVLLVALLVEIGGLGPFITMNLAKVPKVPVTPCEPFAGSSPSSARRPRLIYSARPENLESDLERFLKVRAQRNAESTLGSTELLARYNVSRRKRGLPAVTQRRFGDTMNGLGHREKRRLSGGRVHYQGLAWAEAEPMRLAA